MSRFSRYLEKCTRDSQTKKNRGGEKERARDGEMVQGGCEGVLFGEEAGENREA